MVEGLPSIRMKPDHNYVAFFLTFACNLRCPYCINSHNKGLKDKGFAGSKAMTTEDWVRAANRLSLRDDLPLTLQGGEPTLHKGFYRFVNEVRRDIKMDLLTNMMFDADEFIEKVPPERFIRQAPYAPIRVSYHPEQNDIEDIIAKTLKMQGAGFIVGIYGISHPDENIRREIMRARDRCLSLGLDFREKEFLGFHDDVLYGTFKYEGAVSGGGLKRCKCRTGEIIVGPTGLVYKCHADLYNDRSPIAHILDEEFDGEGAYRFRDCAYYGDCNPCDVKVKTNRLQIFGHTSVDITDIH